MYAAAPAPPDPILAVSALTVAFGRPGAATAVVRGIDFELARGEIVGLVGESGAGKSLTALALAGLAPAGARVAGRAVLEGTDLLALDPRRLRRLLGKRIGFVFQDSATALNPVLSIGFQVAETVRLHRGISRAAAQAETVRLLTRVALPEPERRLRDLPHQLSGGQRQRVALAIALAGGPDVLLADEPTSALDATVQAEILELLSELRRALGLAVLLITHDLGVVAELCDRVLVVYAGRVVESAPVADLFARPAHPYTRALLAALPARAAPGAPLAAIAGHPPDPAALPPGCPFHPRCPQVEPRCLASEPAARALPGPVRHEVRCVRAGEAAPGGGAA